MIFKNISEPELIQRAREIGKFDTFINTGHTLVSININLDRSEGPEFCIIRWCYRCNNSGIVRRAFDLSKVNCPCCDDEDFMQVKQVFLTSAALFTASLCTYLSYRPGALRDTYRAAVECLAKLVFTGRLDPYNFVVTPGGNLLRFSFALSGIGLLQAESDISWTKPVSEEDEQFAKFLVTTLVETQGEIQSAHSFLKGDRK